MIQAWKIRVLGRVQGVGFRYSARREAERLGLAGWVRNSPDGSVEIFVQGDDNPLDIFFSWLNRGPSYSHVREVVKSPGGVQSGLSSFDITF